MNDDTMAQATSRYKERVRQQEEADQSLMDWGFQWPTEIPGPSGGMFGLGSVLFGDNQAGHLNRLAACEDCGTVIGVPVVEDIEAFDRSKSPANRHVVYCPAITLAQRKARYTERVADRDALFDPHA